MKWIFLVAGIASVALLYNRAHQYVLFAAFGVAFVNFATFCLQYEEPANRARARLKDRLQHMKPGYQHTEEFQRSQSAKVKVLPEDIALRWDFLTAVNLLTGVGGMGLCVYGLTLLST